MKKPKNEQKPTKIKTQQKPNKNKHSSYQQNPTKTNKNQQKPTKPNKNPTKTNKNQQKPTKTNKTQQKPTKNKKNKQKQTLLLPTKTNKHSSSSSGLFSSLSFLKPPVRDRAGLMRRSEARRLLHLSPGEEDVGIWCLDLQRLVFFLKKNIF